MTPAIVTITPVSSPAVDSWLESLGNRESWFGAAASAYRPKFEAVGATWPERLRFSTSFPGGRAADSTKHIGQCWYAPSSADGTIEVLISPIIGNPIVAISTLIHELCHACLDLEAGHGPKFRKLAMAMGLEGKMTATVPSAALMDEIQAVIALIGPYPHAELKQGGRAADKPKKQTTRMIKVVCPECEDYIVRMSRKNIERGCPTCPCGLEMVADGGGNGEGEGEGD